MSEDFDPTTLGIIDESEPDEPDEPDADYSREDKAEKSDSPSDDSVDADTSDEPEESPEGKDSAEEPAGEPEKDTPAEGEDGEGEQAEDGPIEFAGREYENLDAIEQSFKSFEGRINAETAKAQDFEQRLADYYEYVQKVGKENEELRARFDEPATETPEPGTAPSGVYTSTETPGEVDLAKVLRVAKIGADRGLDPMEAVIKVYDTAQKEVMDTKLAEMEERLSAPVEKMEADAETNRAEAELFQWGQAQTEEDGSSKYPMLQKDKLDEEFVGNIYEAFHSLSKQFGAKYAYSPLGLEQAYSLAHQYAIQSGKWTDEEPDEPSTEVTPNPGADFNADAEAASDLTGETPKLNRPKKSPGKSALEELSQLAEVTIDGGDPLGFYE